MNSTKCAMSCFGLWESKRKIVQSLCTEHLKQKTNVKSYLSKMLILKSYYFFLHLKNKP